MEWKRNKSRNLEIKKLRQDGFTIKEIANKLQCSKSIVSYHCKNISVINIERLNKKRLQNRTSLPIAATSKYLENIQRERDFVRNSFSTKWDNLKSNIEFVLFLGLYWGEGDKTRRSLGISNNDICLIKKAYNAFKLLSQTKLRGYIYLYNTHNQEICKQFWENEFPDVKFKFYKHKYPPKRGSHEKCLYGSCRLLCYDWKAFEFVTYALNKLKE